MIEGADEVDAGDDQHEGLADGDDQQRHHRAQDVEQRVAVRDLGHDRPHRQEIDGGQEEDEILRQEQPLPGACRGAPALADSVPADASSVLIHRSMPARRMTASRHDAMPCRQWDRG